MHGIIFTALKKYVRTRLGDEAWTNLRTAAGLGDRVYLPVQPYPDSEIESLIHTVAHLSGISTTQLLEDFGRSMVPDLLTMYRPLLQPDWQTLDLLENLEKRIHPAVRTNNPGANPPMLVITRPSPEQVLIRYESPRKWCAFGRGLIAGVAERYGERIQVIEERCMLQGEPCCELVVTKSQSPQSP